MIRKAGALTAKIILVIILLLGMFFIAVYLGAFGHLETRKELINYKNATASSILSDEGKLIGRFYLENRTNTAYQQIPVHLINALVATEDARFFEHGGIDSRSLLRVIFKTILFQERSSGGGSTITQQLAKNMFGRRSFGLFTVPVSKIKEIILAVRLEKVFSKEEILTLYLNTVSFGENIFGIGTASVRYFNKRAEQLTVDESAVLIGILKANTRYNPHLNPENATARRNVILKQMEKYGYLKVHEVDSLTRLPLILNYSNSESGGPADYFLIQVKNEAEKILEEIYLTTGRKWNLEEDGLTISTTLNLQLQDYAIESFHDHLSVMQKRLKDQYMTSSGKRALSEIAKKEINRLNLTQRVKEISLQEVFGWDGNTLDSISVEDSLKQAMILLHAGLLAIDPFNGAVKAWVGGIDFKTQPYDQILAQRQLASVFKPVLYSEALEEGMEPCDYLDNDSIVLAGFKDYSPENFDHSFGGKYSLSGALAQSMNIPTFSLFLKIGFPGLDSMWKKMGFTFEIVNAPSLALGTAEASIREIAVAYSSFANGGYRIVPEPIESIKDPEGNLIWQNSYEGPGTRIMSERSATLMCAMLQKAIREGTGASMSSAFGVNIPLAGKTGTSQDYADAWFAAFNPKLTIVARVGASSPAIHFNSGSNGSGSALALPLVALTLRKVQKDPELLSRFSAPFPPLPAELSDALDCPDFRDESLFDLLRNLFEKRKVEIIKKPENIRKQRKSLFRRIFRR